MNFSRYTIDIPYDALAENLANTYDTSLPIAEHLRSVDDLRRFMTHHGLRPGTTLGSRDLLNARALRAKTRRVFESRDTDQAKRRINALLDGKRFTAALSADGTAANVGWRVAADGGAFEQLEAAVALNLAALLQAVGFERCRICKASPCRDVFVDLSRRGSQIFCGPRCATRVHVARFRDRERR